MDYSNFSDEKVHWDAKHQWVKKNTKKQGIFNNKYNVISKSSITLLVK